MSALPESPVLFRGYELFRIASTSPPFTVQERAVAIGRRIEEAVRALGARDQLQPAADDRGRYARITAEERVLMTVTEADALPAGVAPGELA